MANAPAPAREGQVLNNTLEAKVFGSEGERVR